MTTADNRPYLSRIDYAPDDLTTLRARMIAQLPQVLPGWNPALAEDGSDYGLVLTELFAQLSAILCAYADQRANESFVRTAALSRSLIDLAQLVDYRCGSGASATALQTFLAKDGKAGVLPAGFRLNALPAAGGPPLVFETAADLAVDPSRNQMRLFGYDRSNQVLRLRTSAAQPQETLAVLDAQYAGLKAGMPIVFDTGAALTALPLAAVSDAAGATQILWSPGIASERLDLPIADLVLRGRPQQTARLAAAARADEITLGQNQLPVDNASMFTTGGAVLVDASGLQMPATVLAAQVTSGQSPSGTITLNRGLVASIRRSATRVLEATSCGRAFGTIAAGTTSLYRESLSGKKKDFPHTPAPGDLLLMVDASGVELGTVAQASGPIITLTQPTLRALRPTSHSFDSTPTVRYFFVSPNDPATHQTAVRAVRLGDLSGVIEGSTTVLTLEKAVDRFAAGSTVALTDGLRTSAHRIIEAESIGGQTRLTLDGTAPADLRVATLTVCGDFAHAMRVAGYDHSDSVLAPGASQLEIAGAPLGLTAGMDLVIADGVHAEGARVTQVAPAADRVLVSVSRPLDFAYVLGDVVVYGNVASVSHGERVPEEVLGNGDPASAPQRFVLARSPLAWVPDPADPRGVSPDVEVLVSDERWTRVDTLAGSGSIDRHYVIDVDDRDRATVVFGDGVNGAAPPSGRNNITARYRTGRGMAGNVAAGGISRMPQPASFLDRAFNPAPASGGADRESLESGRLHARLRVRLLDRAVSVGDYADLALAYTGIGKASAALEREGRGSDGRRVIVVTCAATGGNALSSPQKDALLAYLMARSPEPERIRVRDHRSWAIRLALTVTVRPDARQAIVQRALLLAFGSDAGGFFSFDNQTFGGALALSDVYAAVEAIPGVDHAVATLFHAEGDAPRVANRIDVPADAVATGGSASDPAVGRLSLQVIGGLS